MPAAVDMVPNVIVKACMHAIKCRDYVKAVIVYNNKSH